MSENGLRRLLCVPLLLYGTTPCSAGSGGVTEAAIISIEQIDKWWKKTLLNIGFHPEPSGMLVLDVDGASRSRISLRARKSACERPPATYTVQTPRGPDGLHLYFRGSSPNTVGTEDRGLGDHLDTRGKNGYVLLPPSRVNGVEYEQISETNEVAEASTWTHEHLRSCHSVADKPLQPIWNSTCPPISTAPRLLSKSKAAEKEDCRKRSWRRQ